MKALEILKEYKTIDFGCDMSELYFRIDEAITELEQLSSNSLQLNCEGCKWYEVRYHSATCNWCERHPSMKTRNIKDYWGSK